ncbi:MAG: precorrin-6Y C5,15-methyltransferase subunit CbiT [Elainellaceae cyanobacterium]
MEPLWPYKTPGIPDHLFERLPGIPMSPREIRLLLISHLRLSANAVFWDIGAGTGTIPVEVGLLCPESRIIAVERDKDVAQLIQLNCDRFGVANVQIVVGSAPDCFAELPQPPDCICIEGGRSIKGIMAQAWAYLQHQGRIVAAAYSLDELYAISEGLAELQARHIEVEQSAVNRLESRGNRRAFVAADPVFVLSGEKLA